MTDRYEGVVTRMDQAMLSDDEELTITARHFPEDWMGKLVIVTLAPPVERCRHCGEPVHWSLDLRRWVHDPNHRYCVANFDENNNPTTEAEPVEGGDDG